ncbi:MAG: glycine dehydrogenase, partial [Candidatus Sedimenticola endophacoides]
LVPRSLHPAYRRVAANITRYQGIELVDLPFDPATGASDLEALERHAGEDITALVIPQPNFFGVLEPVDEMARWAHANGALAIAVVNPLTQAALKPAGEWGGAGADICCGEGQPLGAPLSSGGPYFGLLCCKRALVRQMPGRIIGRTLDRDGNPGFTLTLQAREQHIRRSKATSNICTNQGLMVTAATIHMALLGGEGLRRVVAACHRNTRRLVEKITQIPGVEIAFTGNYIHEAVLRLPVPVADALRSAAAHNILGGLDLGRDYPELGEALLVCATEKRSDEEIDAFAAKLERVIGLQGGTKCRLVPPR